MRYNPVYVHFTEQEHGEAIVASRRLYASSIVAGVYAVETGGLYVPGTQRTGIGRARNRDHAVLFQTAFQPEHRYVEEVIWSAPSLRLINPRLVTADDAAALLDGRLSHDAHGRLADVEDSRPRIDSARPTEARLAEAHALAETRPQRLRNGKLHLPDNAPVAAAPDDDKRLMSLSLALHADDVSTLRRRLSVTRRLQNRMAATDDPVDLAVHDAFEIGARLIARHLTDRGAPDRFHRRPLVSDRGRMFDRVIGRSVDPVID